MNSLLPLVHSVHFVNLNRHQKHQWATIEERPLNKSGYYCQVSCIQCGYKSRAALIVERLQIQPERYQDIPLSEIQAKNSWVPPNPLNRWKKFFLNNFFKVFKIKTVLINYNEMSVFQIFGSRQHVHQSSPWTPRKFISQWIILKKI